MGSHARDRRRSRRWPDGKPICPVRQSGAILVHLRSQDRQVSTRVKDERVAAAAVDECTVLADSGFGLMLGRDHHRAALCALSMFHAIDRRNRQRAPTALCVAEQAASKAATISAAIAPIADMARIGWARGLSGRARTSSYSPHVGRRLQTMMARLAVQRGVVARAQELRNLAGISIAGGARDLLGQKARAVKSGPFPPSFRRARSDDPRPSAMPLRATSPSGARCSGQA